MSQLDAASLSQTGLRAGRKVKGSSNNHIRGVPSNKWVIFFPLAKSEECEVTKWPSCQICCFKMQKEELLMIAQPPDSPQEEPGGV